MSAKPTRVSSGDEKPEVLLDRHVGCMAGMFQLLGRRRLFAKRRLTNGDRHTTLPPPPPPGTSSSSSSSGRAISSKIKQREEEYKPSSPRTISEQRAPLLPPSPSPSPSSPSSSLLDIRGVVKDSIIGGARGLSVRTSPREEGRRNDVSKHQDSPRPAMSEQALARLREAARSSLSSSSSVPRFSCDGREISRTKSSTKLREVPRLSLDSREASIRSSVIAKLMGLEPTIGTPNAVGSRAEGRAKELDLVKSDSDRELRALKHILGTMLESSKDDERPTGVAARKNYSSNAQTPHVTTTTTASPRTLETPVVVTKPVKSFDRLEAASRGRTLQQAKDEASHTVASKKKKTRILPVQRSPRHQPAERERSGSPVKALSPARVQQRKIELEKKPRLLLLPPPPPPTRTKSADRKLLVDPASPRGNNRPTPNRAQKNGQPHNEDDADAKRGDDCSRRMESLLFQQGKQKKSLRIVKEEVSMADRAAVPPEQPSPISVLDSSFYHDDSSPSPVKRISSTLEGDDMQTSIGDCKTPMSLHGTSQSKSSPEIDSWNLRDIESLVQKLRQLSSTGDSEDESQEPILNYVFEILRASGLLTEHHPSPAKANSEKKLHHRLMLDVVQEVLVQKMELISHGPQSSLFARARKLGGRFLLRELCKEIKWLASDRPRDASFANNDETMMSGENLLPQSEGWEDFGLEVPEVVLEIERLIFKDLIDNVVTGEVDFNLLGRAAQRRRQLFT